MTGKQRRGAADIVCWWRQRWLWKALRQLTRKRMSRRWLEERKRVAIDDQQGREARSMAEMDSELLRSGRGK